MKSISHHFHLLGPCFFLCFITITLFSEASVAGLKEIQQNGVLRHLGVPYARFVTGSGDGFSTDLIKGFAADLGVQYEYVETNWQNVISDLTGTKYKVESGKVTVTGSSTRKGDLIANGLTILPWRQQLITYSTPTFPSGIWLISRADAPLKPIIPSGDINKDIEMVKGLMANTSVLCMSGTCLDSTLYDLENSGAQLLSVNLKMNEFAPAVINKRAQASLLDVADALIALEKWPGQIKVIGPLSAPQEMAVGFHMSDIELIKRFNRYLSSSRSDGRYMDLIHRYYPDVEMYFPDFFERYR